ncbi:glycoside hydrolase family 79 protein [Dothistroma septosporum NZE10]|uniref:Glycoside hydrolase family 79 protein n=1 Tax=Dothistroma septosporum (strain NZE10 / CBS 128990) TaxID=675120 RepID=N1PQC1_DOTSN|nr:glycoside hydrolase family 79 protein [Dothistroma septosporum NZE10]
MSYLLQLVGLTILPSLVSGQYNVTIPAAPSSATVDRSFAGFAFEQASFFNFAFDANGSTNTFSVNLIDSVANRTGGIPILRVGGTSGDLATVNTSQAQAVNLPATNYGPSTSPALTLSPAYFDAFKMFNNAQYVFMVPLRQRNITSSLQFAQYGMAAIGNRLQALEIGNEPDFYDWFSSTAYANEFKDFQSALIDQFPGALKGLGRSFTPAAAFGAGLDTTDGISQVALHLYQANDPPNSGISYLQSRIANHTAIVANMAPFLNAVAYLRATQPNISLVLSENGNSLGNMDLAQRNNLATCLWNVDYQLYALSIGVSRVNNQQIVYPGFGMWVPVQSTWESPQVRANYYSQPFIADFIGSSGNTRVVELPINGTALVSAYVAFDGDRPSRLAIVNLALWTPSQGPRPFANVTISGLPSGIDTALMRVLSSPDGALSQDNLRYGGLRWTYESNGRESAVSQQGRNISVLNGAITLSVQAAAGTLVIL